MDAFRKNFLVFIRYGVIGTLGTFIDLGALYVLVEYARLPILLAAIFSFILAATNNFILNKIWTFGSRSRNYRKLYIKFLIVSIIGLGLTVICMFVFVSLIGIYYLIAKALTSLIVLTWNFLGNKYWTFKVKIKPIDEVKSDKYDLSIIIPAYNEAQRIVPTLQLINNYLIKEKKSAEIIVINDGSSDRTDLVVSQLPSSIKNLVMESYVKNQGKGYAVRRGVERAQGRFILFTDADNSTPIEELAKLENKLFENQADIAIGSRYLPDSLIKRKQPAYRVVLSRLGNFVIRLFLIDNIKDTQCGFKLFKADCAKRLFSFQKVKRFGFDMEILVIAQSWRYKIIEVPVSWINSSYSRVRPVRDAFKTFLDLIYIKLNLWSGRYFTENEDGNE